MLLTHGLPPERGTKAFESFWNLALSSTVATHPACLEATGLIVHDASEIGDVS